MPGPLYPIQPVFARGELSPRLFSRVDVDHWKMGLAECVNWLVMKQGGLRRRPGTEWINFGKYPGQKCRLQRFVFSTLQAYVIEFGAYYLRVYANGGIVNRNAATGITFVLPNTVHWPSHGLAANYPVMFSTQGTLPAPLVPGLTYYVTGGDANGFQISTAPGGSVITFTTAGSGVHSAVAPVEIATPYDIDHVWKLQFSQSADILYIASQDFEPRMLSRFSGSTFQLVVYSGYDGPYLPDNTTGTTMQPSATAGDVTISASSVVGINGNAGFQPTDVNRWISLQYSSKWYAARIYQYLNGGQVNATVHGLIDNLGNPVGAFPGTDPTGGWKLGAWSEVTGWPGSVTFFQQRLVWGRTDTQPQTVWMSKAGVLDNFSTTVPAQEDDALTLTILAGEVNAISWMAEGADLMIGTSGAMRTIGAADSSKNFGPTNFQQRRQSTFGSLDLQPVQVGEVAIYPGFFGLSLREFLFSFQVNGYISPELTILSEHMLRSGIKQFAFAQDRDSIIWNAMGNGELVGVTYDRDQQIVACTRHRIGGHVVGVTNPDDPSDPNTPFGIVESVTTIPGADRHEVWLSVRRTINGLDVRHIERLTVTFEGMQKEDAVFVDASYSYVGAEAGTITGANWIAGETVSILADGAVSPEQTLNASGSFTLANGETAKKITFGLNYLSRAKTLPIAQGQPDGTGIGRRKNIITANIDVMETGYLEAGSPSARELQVKVGLRGVNDAMDSSPPLHNGIFSYRFDRSWRDNGQVVMQSDKPLPATIRSITPVFDAEP
jgi:hypothetical protein